MKTYRQAYRSNGRRVVNFNTLENKDNSVIIITASEFKAFGNNPHHRFVGDANVWVSNVSPHGPPYDPNRGVTLAPLQESAVRR